MIRIAAVFCILVAAVVTGLLVAEDDMIMDDGQTLAEVGESRLTLSSYQTALNMLLAGYGEDFASDDAGFSRIKVMLLFEMIDELFVREHARVNGISVSPGEVKTALNAFYSDFTADSFRLLAHKRAITEDDWEKRFAQRLLMEKTLRKDLEGSLNVLPGELASFCKRYLQPSELSFQNADAVMEAVLKQKMEDAYGLWMEDLMKRYHLKLYKDRIMEKLDINEIIGEGE